jgi:hypothetical protein
MLAAMIALARVTVFGLLAVFSAGFAYADLLVGSKRADVIAELGKPTSAARRGAQEILLYPKGVRIELERDVVVDLKGYIPTATAGVATPAVTSASPATPAAAPSANSAPAPKPAKKPAAHEDDDFNPAVAANALGDEVAKMDTAWGSSPPPMPQKKAPSPLELIVGMLLRFGITIMALRVAFKYWEMDAFWKGTFAIAGIDAVVHGSLTALSPMTGGFTTLGHVDEAIAWFVMIFTIQYFCFNKRIQNALLTAVFVNVLVSIWDIFISIALRNAIFG